MLQSLTHSAMFFNDLGCFEIESQSFTRLTPSARDFDFLLPSPLDSAPTVTTSTSVDATPASVAKTSSSSGSTASSSSSGTTTKSKSTRAKPLLKKRTNVLALEVNQPKPRTPRRKLNCGNAFEDIDTQSPRASSSSVGATATQFYSSVGTPSNFSSAEVSRMWSQDIDFAATGSYVDTFLDLPTPKSAEMPVMHALSASSTSSQQQQSSTKGAGHLGDDLGQPKLIRTTSIEQEGLSHFFQQATLDSTERSSSPSQQTPLCYNDASYRHESAHHHQIKKNQIDLSGPYAHAAIGVVDECFSKMMPSPHGPHTRRNSLLLSSSAPSGSASQFPGLSRLLSATPRGTLRTPRGTDPTFDHKNMPEFETLLDEYKFTDMDQELDSFYLDTIESFGGDLDLISN